MPRFVSCFFILENLLRTQGLCISLLQWTYEVFLQMFFLFYASSGLALTILNLKNLSFSSQCIVQI